MDKRTIFKKSAKFIVGSSVSYSLSKTFKAMIQPEKLHQKVECYVGGTALGLMAAEYVEQWIDEKFEDTDEIVHNITQLKSNS